MAVECKSKIEDCKFVNRIIAATKEIHHSTADQLIVFCKETYPTILDDYIHVVTEHNTDEPVTESPTCNVTKCQSIIRQYGAKDSGKNTNDDPDNESIFYRDIIDSIHCYFHHRHELSSNNVNANRSAISPTYRIRSKSKFSVVFNQCNEAEKDALFQDSLYDFMMENKTVSLSQVERLRRFFSEEEYDSECIFQDINIDNFNKKTSNIATINNECHKVIKHCVRRVKLHEYASNSSYSAGYRFYYWRFYQDHKMNDDNNSNKNDYSEYGELNAYVAAKYDSIKDEILTNSIFILKTIQFNIALHKAKKFNNTQKVRGIKAYNGNLHYGISSGSSISTQHLLSLILYCDWTLLSLAFSSTFRKQNLSDSISKVKRRNAEFGNFSRLLRETVELFGDTLLRNNYHKKPQFFCRISYVMIPLQFNVRLCSPTSTSKMIQIPTRFDGDNGIILHLSNDFSLINKQSRWFNCAWISNYPMEGESLFCGGKHKLRIQNIKIMSVKQNFDKYFNALYYFDCMINNSKISTTQGIDISEQDNIIINNLIKHKAQNKPNKYARYINNIFKAFTNCKTKIILNLKEIKSAFIKFSNIVLSNSNQIQPSFIQLFPNIKTITVFSFDSKAVDLSSLSVVCGFQEHSRSLEKNKQTIHCSISQPQSNITGFDEQIMGEFDIILHNMGDNNNNEIGNMDNKKENKHTEHDAYSLLLKKFEKQSEMFANQQQKIQQQEQMIKILNERQLQLFTSLQYQMSINDLQKQNNNIKNPNNKTKNKMKNKKKQLKKQIKREQKNRFPATDNITSYDPPAWSRGRKQVDIPKDLTKKTLPHKMGGKKQINWYKYLEKLFARQFIDHSECFTDDIIAIDYNCYDVKLNEIYYIIAEKLPNLKPNIIWKMRNKLFTLAEIKQMKHNILIPSSLLICLEKQLKDETKIISLLNTYYNKIMVIKQCDIRIFRRKNKLSNKQQLLLCFEKIHFNKLLLNLKESVINNISNNTKLIPILTFNHNPDAYRIEFVLIIRIYADHDIGLSFIYNNNENNNENEVEITGIHLDKMLLYEQHTLALPRHVANKCDCLDNYNMDVSNIKISGDLNEDENKYNAYKQKYESLKPIVFQIMDASIADLQTLKQNARLMMQYHNGSLKTLPSMLPLNHMIHTHNNIASPIHSMQFGQQNQSIILNNNNITSVPLMSSIPSITPVSHFIYTQPTNCNINTHNLQ